MSSSTAIFARTQLFSQIQDSVTITNSPILHELLFPVGMRYHALHHMMPGMPYHNLGHAHRRLMAELGPDSPYRDTLYSSIFEVYHRIFVDIRAAKQSAAKAGEWEARAG